MITLDKLVDDVFAKEGDAYGDRTTKPPIDQPTGRGGIILSTLQEYRGRTCTAADLKALTHEDARTIVRWKLGRIGAQAKIDLIAFEPLRLQMIDFSYNSGAALAIRWLQRVLRVKRTGKIDATTRGALERQDLWLVHQALMGARLEMIDMATDPGGKVDHRFEEGLENRALTFSLLEVP